jgi:CheY-like chemotaxis protein
MSKRSREINNRVIESVMVVEPDVLVRMTVADYLRECGYRVVEAITGEEALGILGAGVKVDTILSAVKLQDAMDGFALAQRIREGFDGVAVILTTGYAMTAKKAGELCELAPGKRPYHADLIVDRLKLLFEKHRPKSG